MTKWYNNCKVTMAGASSWQHETVVGLIDDQGGAFPDRQFIAAPDARTELLAAALTANSTGQRVNAQLDDGAPEQSTLYALYVVGT